jgi:extracellular elastinolytic metalloproteinase
MNRPSCFVASASSCIAILLLSAPAFAQNAPGLDRRPAQSARGTSARPLTAASAAAPDTIVANYLRGRGDAQEKVASLRADKVDGGARGVRHLRMKQEVGGLEVHGAYLKAAVNARGELVSVIDRLADVSSPTASRIDARTALSAAIARLYPNDTFAFRSVGAQGNATVFDGGAFFHERPQVTAVLLPLAGGSLARGWRVETWAAQSNQLHYTIVDGEGRILDIESRTAQDSYNIFPVDPGKGAQLIVAGPGTGNAQSPAGWLGSEAQTTIQISGNNTKTYLDTSGRNRPDRGGSTVTTGNFLTAADFASAPSTTENKEVAVQNLFYLNNRIHDILYTHGFDEAAGNFQVDNFGKGGAGNDAVLAEAQDGSGTDNANFATPADGRNPRMQMFLWTGAGSTHEVRVNAPSMITYGAMGAEFGPTLSTTGVTGDVVAAVPADACTAVSAAVSGKVALVDRGACDFTVKVLNAQSAGATAVIVANNQGGTAIFTMGAGANAKRVRIGSVMISQNDGSSLKSLVAPNATMRRKAVQPLQLDSWLDSDIVYHEYGHGLSWRMIGGMSGPLAGAIGEGNSDGVAMLVNGDPAVGEYAASSPIGIRRFSYSGYPLTYGDVTGAGVHDDGEIYAAIVWRMIELFGTRRATLFSYVVDGMNYTPSTPAYEDMRDGILASVANGATPADCSLVWQAFAQFGVGVGAQGVVNNNGTVQITESFQQPSNCAAP